MAPLEPHHYYRREPEEPTPLEPREELGALAVPVLGAMSARIGLGRPLRLEIDRRALDLQLGSGVEVLTPELPAVALRRMHVDLIDGEVHSDNDALGPAFDRALTIALCGVLRHTIGWQPGVSSLDLGVARLRAVSRTGAREARLRAGFPRVHAALHREAGLTLEVRGDAIELVATRPLMLRILGLSLAVLTVRYVFATATIEVSPGTLGPVRQALLRWAARLATRWLRRRLPAEMLAPGYDLFADPDRRDHLLDLVRRVRADRMAKKTGAYGPGAPAQERVGEAASLFSATRAALAVGLATFRVSADELPRSARALVKIPLGPLGDCALCTERGASAAVIKYPGGLRFEAERGIWLHVDQFPELIELRLARVRAHAEGAGAIGLDARTDPPLGLFLRALLSRLYERYLLPRIPVRRLQAGGVFPPDHGAEHHVLWRQSLGDERELVIRTEAGATVELRHEEHALVVSAPAGLSVLFNQLAYLPHARLRRIEYRWADGTLVVDGEPALGPFGQAVLAELARTRLAPRVPEALGLLRSGGPALDADRLARFSAEVLGVTLPLIGRLELRMDPGDRITGEVGPVTMSLASERGLALVAADLGLALELRGARYDLRDRALEIDSSPPPGEYLIALAGLCVAAFVVPALRRIVPLWPDADPDQTWLIRHVHEFKFGGRPGLALDLSLPPGARLTAARGPDALEIGATTPLQVTAGRGLMTGEFMVAAIRWRPEGGRVECVTVPPAGPLLHALLTRVGERLAPKAVLHALASRLALAEPSPPAQSPPAPASAPLLAPELPVLGPLYLHVDRRRPLVVDLRRDGACFGFGDGLVLRVPDLEVDVRVRGAALAFLPLDVDLVSDPAAGELERWLLGHVVRGLFAHVLRWFWPGHRAAPAGHEVLLSFAADQPWGPVDVCVPLGGALELALDDEGLTLRAPSGLSITGDSLQWLPGFALYEFTYRFVDGAVCLRAGGVAERYYRETEPVGRNTEATLAHLIRTLVLPHMPGWAQRLGARILPQPAVPPVDPERITVLQLQLPGGHGRVLVRMDPNDTLTLRADRRELGVGSARHVQIEVPNLHLRVDFFWARCHVPTGEVQIGTFGQLENALVEAALRRALAAYEPGTAEPGASALAAVLDRFPIDAGGRRVLYASKLGRLLLRPDTALVVRLDPQGLVISADPPLEIDGVSALDYRFGELRYSFDDAAFHLDLARDRLLAGLFHDLVVAEGEHQLGSLLRPLLPARMRKPGYRLASDPDPQATIAALVRTVAGGGALLAS